MESCTFAILTLKPDLAALHFHQTLCDIQTQTCAGRFTGFGVFRAEEFLEHLLLIFQAQTDTIILDPQMNDARRTFWIPVI